MAEDTILRVLAERVESLEAQLAQAEDWARSRADDSEVVWRRIKGVSVLAEKWIRTGREAATEDDRDTFRRFGTALQRALNGEK